MKYFLFLLAVIFILLYSCIAGLTTLAGYDDADTEHCQTVDRMKLYVMPSYRLGCWLGQRID